MERKVKTVARQHTTSIGIQQGIQFLRFLSPGLQWKYKHFCGPLLNSKNHKGECSMSLYVVFPEPNYTSICSLTSGIHKHKFG